MSAAEEKSDSSAWRWLWWLLFAVLFYFVCPALWSWPIIKLSDHGFAFHPWMEAFVAPLQWLYDQWPAYQAWVNWTMEKVGPR